MSDSDWGTYPDEPAGPDRTPPQDLRAERAVLGGMLLSPRAIEDVTDTLTGADFYRPAHETIFDAILAVHASGQPADAVTVGDRLADRGEFARIGGAAYLHELMDCVAVAANAGWHAVVVRKCAVRRRFIEAGTRITQMGYETDGADLAEVLNKARDMLAEADTGRSGDLIDPVVDVLPEALSRMEKPEQTAPVRARTGIQDLDDLMRLVAGRFTVIAARPAIGKSLMALCVARASAIGLGTPTALFSLEMPIIDLATCLICAEAKVDRRHAEYARLDDAEWARVNAAVGRIADAPLFIDDSSNLDLANLRSKIRALQKGPGCELVIIDYLQLMQAPRASTRQESVSQLSRSLKLLAMELHIPIIALCQLNRGPESRSDKKPMMSDLRESGALEQDPDNIILLHREDAYERESPRAGEIDLIVAKHRGGPQATVTAAFQGHYARIAGMAWANEEQSR